MHSPRLVLQSVTGVDVELQIAGPGSRSLAFVIDWLIRSVFGGVCYIGIILVYGGLAAGTDSAILLIALIPALIIYFFYQPLVEIIMRGRSPGKRLAGVRVLTLNGEIPSLGALLVRNVFRLIDSLPSLYIVGLLCVMFSRHHVRIGDMAAGTLLVMDATESEQTLDVLGRGSATGSSELSPAAFELVHELLERWPSMELAARDEVARKLLTKIDPTAAVTLMASSSFDLYERLRAVMIHGRPA